MLFRVFSFKFVFVLVSALMSLGCSEQEDQTQVDEKPMTIVEMLAQQQAAASPTLGTGEGRIETFETYMATIHSYTAPEDSYLVTSHIIETDNSLVMIDAQFLRPYAQQLRDYVDSLEKPLERIYLTSADPEYWFGLELFSEVPVYAQASIFGAIVASSEDSISANRKALGDLVAETLVTDIQGLQVHSDIFDGLTYEFEIAENSNASPKMLIHLPEVNLVFAQSLLSNNAHAFFAVPDIQEWIRSLAILSVDAKEADIFAGYGYPARTDAQQINRQIAYLQTVKQILADHQNTSAEEMATAMKAAYPELGAEVIVDMSSAAFFVDK